ncbi:Fe2OG dioxygenase domain-containing protein [Aphelenchoides besseyi]|nr:Fe2OG dioxygenase domain-containing protein [Aphelenchoides besseyi]KAI6201250.1 Fe2OG dioxygenase domain-containing protein [Aphelenchoides besseyi]
MVKTCGCKGVRFCALCKDSDRVKGFHTTPEEWNVRLVDYDCYIYSNGYAYQAKDLNFESSIAAIYAYSEKINSGLTADFAFSGIKFLPQFITPEEETRLVKCIDKDDWLISQSGRRKQDYGPRVNFKQKKVKCDRFVGVPDYADLILERLTNIDDNIFGNYEPFELCNLEYDNERQSGIELHQDDVWIWGNRLISLNLISDSVMTFENKNLNALVFIPMPRRSLLFFFDEARYDWAHGIFPHHIENRRIALTMREAGADFVLGGELHEKFGKELLERSKRRIPKLSISS